MGGRRSDPLRVYDQFEAVATINEVQSFIQFPSLEEEMASAEYQGKPIIVLMDANSKLGPNHIQGDPHEISRKKRNNHTPKTHSKWHGTKHYRLCVDK